MKTLISIYLIILIVISSGFSCTTRSRQGVWRGKIDIPPQQATELIEKTLSRKPYDFNVIITPEGQIETDYYYYKGKQSGFWIFGTRWQERIYITGIIVGDNFIRSSDILIFAHPQERMNDYWEWQDCNDFERAERNLKEIVRPLRNK